MGEDGPREILAHAVDLREERHGLLAAQDAAGVGIQDFIRQLVLT